MKFISLLVLITNFATQANVLPTVIYGDDNRRDIYETTDAQYLLMAESTVALIRSSKLSRSGDMMNISSRSLRQAIGACSDEPFANQPTAANCSGFLVAEDTIVTAGHCIRSQSSCEGYKFVFDFKMEDADTTSISVPQSSVYSCKKLIKTELRRGSGSLDYAVVKLDRAVTDRAPLKFRKTGIVDNGAPLVLIGHPSGLPTKISDGAIVRDNDHGANEIAANVDAYGGNSGSAVFNVDTGEIEGILVRGARDYVYRGGCRRSNRVADDYGTGEIITKITAVKEIMDL